MRFNDCPPPMRPPYYGQSLYNPPDDVSIPPDPGPGSPPWVYPHHRPTPTAEINLGWALMLLPVMPLVVTALMGSALLKDRSK